MIEVELLLWKRHARGAVARFLVNHGVKKDVRDFDHRSALNLMEDSRKNSTERKLRYPSNSANIENKCHRTGIRAWLDHSPQKPQVLGP